jgi:diguanylate cyclase (GGDEF)-like protein/PAS domain S-box-containing protein
MIQEKDKYGLLIENLPDGFAYHKMVLDNTGKPIDYIFLEVNSSFETLTGLYRENVIGKKVTEVHPGIRGLDFDWIDIYGKVAAAGQSIHFQQYFDLQDRWYEITAYSDQPGYFAAVFRDITENKKAEEELRESKAQYADLYENAPEMYVSVDPETGRIVRCNETLVRTTGYTKEEIIGRTVFEMYHPDCLEKVRKTFQQFVTTGEVRDVELQARRKDGSKLDVSLNVSAVHDASGKILHSRSSWRDITERKQAEEKNNWLASFPTLNPTPVLEIDQKKGLIFINTSAKKLFPDLENKQMDHPFVAGTIKYFTELNSSTVTHDNREIEVDGHWYLQSLFLVTPNHLRIYASDITERKKAEEELRESEERFRLSINATEDGIWEWDIQNNQEFFSPRWCEIIGYSFDDPELPHTYKSWESRIHPDDYGRVVSALNSHLEKGTKYDVDYRHRHKSGEYRWQNSIGQAVFDESGKPTKMVGCIRDITERKQMERKLEEMATHDFLTGLPNRVLLLDRFTIAAALAHRNKYRLAVLSLDLDKFKSINDTLGHDAGDQVLKVISTRLTGIIRASDTLARIGGDEFLLVMLETSHLEDTATIAQKILDSFTEPLLIDGHQLHFSTSIGIALYPEDAEDLETLTKKSDAAMYYSKGHGRNQFKFFGDGDVWISGDHKSAT